MKVAFITRSTLYAVPGGDTVQVSQTARFLRDLGVYADICLTHEKIDYRSYDVLHFVNITRPSDILFHISKTKRPYAISPVLVDYSEYDRYYRKGLSGFLLSRLPADKIEYSKTIARWLARKDKLRSKSFVWRGQHKSIKKILEKASMVLPNSESEYRKIEMVYGIKKDYCVVPNGIDPALFARDLTTKKEETVVLCVARIEGIKNQYNLIRALNGTRYSLLLVGSPAPNQKQYYAACKKNAAKNILFQEHVPQEMLINYYKVAKVHALPSWFETCGLSSLEAAAMGCNVTISEKGFTRDYFGDSATYCDPGDPESIFNAIEIAARSNCNTTLQEKIHNHYTWQNAAKITLQAYKKIMSV